MSENTFDEYSFRDYYKAENSDDEENNNDLLTRLYGEIYYPSNNEIDLGADVLSNAVPLSSCIINESMNRQENIRNLNNNIAPEFEVVREQEEPVAEEFVQTNKKNLADQEINNTAEILENKKDLSKKHKSPKQPKKKHRERPQKKNIVVIVDTDDSDTETKYNVLHKKMKQEIRLSNAREENSEDSDSESILEVPIPPKPEPLLIDLQDSDDKDAGSSIDEDDLFDGRLHCKNASKDDSRVLDFRDSSPEVEIIEKSLNHQNTAAESNTAHKSSRNKNTLATTNDKSRRAHEVHEDIVLNCTKLQKGAKSINEIKQLSKNTERNTIETSIESTSLKKKSSQDISRSKSSSNVCTSQEPCQTSQEGEIEVKKRTKKMQKISYVTNNTLMHDFRHAQTLENTLLEVSCGSNNNLVMSQKRHSEGNEESGEDREGGESGEVQSNNPARKRQCTVQQSDQPNVAPTPQSSNQRKVSSLAEYFFTPLPDVLKKFYNDSRGQENFDVHEIQRDMSKDPKKWMILDEDLMPSPAVKRGRYWNSLRCAYCQRDGHLRKDCPEPPKIRCCHMCGTRGHVSWRCPQQICLTCGKKQNTYRKNCENCRTLYCIMCCSVGHKKENCPDLWRRYHSVTRETGRAPRNPGNMMKPPSQLYCCNCSKRGHESSMCKEYRWSTHFPTPMFVTNYTEGPVYELQGRPENILMNTETRSVPSFKTRSNRMLNQQMHGNTSVTEAEAPPFSPDVDASPSSTVAETNEETYAQSTQEQVMTISDVTMIKFANVMYGCGNFYFKDNPDARVLVNNLSQHKELCREGKQLLQNRFSNGTVLPIFLKKLRKRVNFEIMFGLLADQSDVMVQLIAPKDCICLLFQLLLYWLNLPLIEKKNGLDVNLPTQVGPMYSFLKNVPRKFEEIKDPLQLYNDMNSFKDLMINIPKNKEYFHNQTSIWDIQTKLLAFINTNPEPSIHFRKILSYIKMLYTKTKCRILIEQLDAFTYLDILISYNNVYTPHTPPNLQRTLKYIMKQNANKVQKFIPKQEFPSDANVNSSIPFATSSSYSPQEFDTVINPFAFVNTQNVPHDTSNVIKTEDVDICQPGISDIIEKYMQYPQDILPFDVEPIAIQLENSQMKDGQSLTDKIKINTNMVTEPNISVTDKVSNPNSNKKLLVREKHKSERKQSKANKIKKNSACRREDFRKSTLKVVNKARAFKIPYMMRAAEDLLRKLKDMSLTRREVKMVKKMMKMENKKLIKNSCNT